MKNWHYKCVWLGDDCEGKWSRSHEYHRVGLGDVTHLLEKMERTYGEHQDLYVIGDRLYEHFYEDDCLFIWEWREVEAP